MHAIAVCPLCGGDIATNDHPLEKRVALVMSVPLSIAMALFTPFPGPITGVLLGIALLICLVATICLQVQTKNWQRYKRYAPEG